MIKLIFSRFYVTNMLLFTLTGIFFSHCTPKSDKEKTPVARVYDKFLYKEDLAKIIPKDASKQDSMEKANNFIDFWVKEQAFTRTAELNLPEEQKNVANELERYRITLLIERYKRRFLLNNLDTIITKEQIQAFYDKHKEEFKLSQPAVKVDYVKVLSTAPNISKVERLYTSNLKKDKLKIEEYCNSHSALYQNFNNDWIYFHQLMLSLPLTVSNVGDFLKRKRNIAVKDSIYSYYVNIGSYRLKGEISPLTFVEDNIQSMLLNQRKRSLIDSLQKSVYNNMIDDGTIEIFDKKKKSD